MAEDSVAAPENIEMDIGVGGEAYDVRTHEPVGTMPVPLMAVSRSEAGDLIITIPKNTAAGDLIMSLLNGLRSS